jgi:aryl-alcohol dehydrogenase-like predicted oxidoreductase
MSLWQIPPPPPTKLGRYRVLSPNAGVRVSPLQLGAMSLGDKWSSQLGSMDKESSFKLLDAFYDAGVSVMSDEYSPATNPALQQGNFIDTANNYQDETSEMLIGEWAEKRGIRDQLVIATKYTTNYKRGVDAIPIKINYTGNSHRSLHLSVEASLKKLRTTYIDILYVHCKIISSLLATSGGFMLFIGWAYDTSIEEVMSSLHNLVAAGKVLYLVGSLFILMTTSCTQHRVVVRVSRYVHNHIEPRRESLSYLQDTPAWVVSKANQWAKDHGKTPFCIYQGKWNVLERSFERDIIPMARSEGLALAPWGVVGQGRFMTDAEEKRRKESGEGGRRLVTGNWERNPEEVKISHKLEEIAKEVGVEDITAVAIAYVMHVRMFNCTAVDWY